MNMYLALAALRPTLFFHVDPQRTLNPETEPPSRTDKLLFLAIQMSTSVETETSHSGLLCILIYPEDHPV